VKRCSRCGETKPLSEFHERSTSSMCRPCTKAYNREYYERNQERLKGRTRDWAATNPERKRERDTAYRAENHERLRQWHADYKWGHAYNGAVRTARKWGAVISPFTIEELAAKFALWNDCCWICGDPATDIDHVKPFGRGGAHALCNVRPICQSCNRRKAARWPVPSRGWLLGFTNVQTPYLAGDFAILSA